MMSSHPALADFLDHQRDSITAEWLRLVRADRKIPSADDLPRAELLDHLPTLLDALIRRLHGRAHAGSETDQQSQVHGETRSQQNYRLPEMLREVSILRTVLIARWVEFDEVNGRERRVQLESSAILHEILDNVIAESTAGFVDHQQEQLVAVNRHLEEANTKAEALNAQLAELDARRLRMLRTITHEIANHLNAAGLMTSLLKRSNAATADSETERCVASIARSIGGMTTLMRQLLEYSLLASAEEKSTPETLHPRVLFEEIARFARSHAEEKGLAFAGHLAPELGDVVTDADKLRRVCLNLVTNAVKYTPSGRLALSFEPHDESHWRIEVSDTGIGIGPEEQTQIFDEFYRAKSDASAQGVGLGLAITRQLIELLRGRIELESAAGAGSRFRVILPIS